MTFHDGNLNRNKHNYNLYSQFIIGILISCIHIIHIHAALASHSPGLRECIMKTNEHEALRHLAVLNGLFTHGREEGRRKREGGRGRREEEGGKEEGGRRVGE